VLTSEGWRFLSINHHGNHVGTQYWPDRGFGKINDEMYNFWDHVTIDNGFQFDTQVDRSSLRLVRLRVEMSDATDLLFPDEDHRANVMRKTALAKLTDEEANMLGLGVEYAKMKIFMGTHDDHAHEILKKMSDHIDEVSCSDLIEQIFD
jgi:hypothetical protein